MNVHKPQLVALNNPYGDPIRAFRLEWKGRPQDLYDFRKSKSCKLACFGPEFEKIWPAGRLVMPTADGPLVRCPGVTGGSYV